MLENQFSEHELEALDTVMKQLREYGVDTLEVSTTGPVTINGRFGDKSVSGSAHDFTNACRVYRQNYRRVMAAADQAIKTQPASAA